MAGEYLTPTPYANPLTGLSNDAIQGLLGYMKDKQRTQQMQMLAGLLEGTGIPQTVERAAYADSPKALLDALTNVNRANVPLLKAETADAIMNVAPFVGPAAKGAERAAMAAGRAGERYAEKVVPQIMERGGLPAQLLGDLSQGSIRPMDVWHGSPYIFEKFDPTKIGTGEGAQMYGKGTYLAQQQEVAKRFTPRDTKFEDALMSKYNQAEKSGDYASMQVYEDFLTQKTPEEVSSGLLDMGYSDKELASANKALETAKKLYQEQTQGALYKVDLPDTQIRRMIDWDAPLKDQPYNVRNLAEKYGMEMNDLGGDLVWKVGKTEEGQKIMQDAGIPGIKYFDQMAKGDEKNARNFVVFDPEKMTILERNAKEIVKKQSLLD